MNEAIPRRTAVVVGASTWGGREIAVELASTGYRVLALLDDDLSNTNTDEFIRWVACKRALRGALVQDFLLGKGGSEVIDVLVVNVPYRRERVPFAEITDEQFNEAIHRLVLNVAECDQALLPMLTNGSQIIHITSRGHLGAWGGAHLMAGSAALVALTRSLALELESRGVAVNAITTDFIDDSGCEATMQMKVARAVAFLARSDSGLVGHTLLLDAGRSLRMAESRRRW